MLRCTAVCTGLKLKWYIGLSHQKNCNGLVTRILLFAASLKNHTAAILGLPSALASCAGVISVGLYKPVCPWRRPT